MKVTKEKAAENRELILKEAARLFRERGVAGVGVDALTEAAGMTHGSLYSQFGSKNGLVAEALTYGQARIAERAAGLKSLPEAAENYISAKHRDNPGEGCFMAAMAGEMRTQGPEVRRSFTEVAKSNLARLSALLMTGTKKQREDETLATMATMVGAIVLARAVDDPELSERILTASRAKVS
jgi:TetR/AcrR family transcriptional repressor of nem operon